MLIHEHAGQLTINAHSDGVNIIVIDKRSGVYAASVKCDPANFLAAIARNGNVKCEFWLNESGNVGADRESKNVMLLFDNRNLKHPKDTDPGGYRTKEAIAALAEYEVDGWRGEANDLWNNHQRTRVGDEWFQTVRFSRFVRDGKPIGGE